MYSHCEKGGGWIQGNMIDGTQAEYVRISFADTSLYGVPRDADEDSLGKLEPKKLITHTFKLDDVMKAYDTFGNAAKEKALKVLLKAA